jgi:hypothetical protein
MTKVLLSILLMGSVVCGATNFPFHIGMGSKASTVGKISSYSRVGNGLWTGYWKPNMFTVSVQEEVFKPMYANAWPNPTTGTFNIDYVGHVNIFSQLGNSMFEGVTEGRIDISTFPSGVYFVRTQDGRTVKVVKQ